MAGEAVSQTVFDLPDQCKFNNSTTIVRVVHRLKSKALRIFGPAFDLSGPREKWVRYKSGMFEIQDESSQLVGLRVDAKPGDKASAGLYRHSACGKQTEPDLLRG